jgi:glycerol-3-phosphate dehydrogenase
MKQRFLAESLDIGIVGAGINGMCTAWLLAQDGHKVTVYERNTPMSATSSASSKLLHGGLRYLENLEFRLVKEALQERDAWFQRAPHLAKPLQLMIPVYANSCRSRWQYAIGLGLYDRLAKSRVVPRSQWHGRQNFPALNTGINAEGLKGAYSFWDGQMDDHALGLWVTEQSLAAGVQLKTNADVQRISPDGRVHMHNGTATKHQRVVNVAGPWAEQLAEKSGIPLQHKLDLVRGSHIVLSNSCAQAWLLEVPGEKRIFFVLPWQGKTMVGTTEVRQGLVEPTECSQAEQEYLLKAYNHFFPAASCQVESAFAGLRPLIKSAANPTQATREYALEQQGLVTTVLGGKWTTSMALARKVKEKVIH